MTFRLPKKLRVEDLSPISSSELDKDSNTPGALKNGGACSGDHNPQPSVAFATIRRRPIFQRLQYCQYYPGIVWGINSKYNDYMPSQQVPCDFDTHSSVLSVEYNWMDYMAFGYESDEYYEADEDSDIEEAPLRDRQRYRRGRRSRYVEVAGTTPESIVRYYINNAMCHSAAFQKDNVPRQFLAGDYTGAGLTHSDLEKLQSMGKRQDREDKGNKTSDNSFKS